jgi:hypothetical protein
VGGGMMKRYELDDDFCPISLDVNPAKVQESFAWDDEEMKTPSHDKIMVWLHQNINEEVAKLYNVKNPMDEKLYDDATNQFELNLKARHPKLFYYLQENNFAISPPEIKPELTIVNTVEWERAVVSNKKYIVGYIDLFAKVDVFYGWQIGIKNIESIIYNKECLDIDYFWMPKYDLSCIYFEVKPKIKSLGETIRQVRKYQVYDRDGNYVLVSPDTRFKEILSHQGIPQVVVPKFVHEAA